MDRYDFPIKTNYNTTRGFFLQVYIGPGAGDG